MTRPRRRARERIPSGATAVEWAWLTAAPGHNRFLGFGTGQLTSVERLRELWKEHEKDIRAAWRSHPPAQLPHGHPAAD